MRRDPYIAGHRMNPETTEKFPTDFRSGDTLPDADYDTPDAQLEMGDVKNGLAYKAPLYEHQPEYSTKKTYKKDYK